MSKKKKHQKVSSLPVPSAEGISGRGKKAIGVGLGVLVLGYIVLSMTDTMGRNWASLLSPFLILGGYAIVGIGIFLPETSESDAPSSDPS